MGHPTKVQLIQRTKGTDQWYVNFPTAVANAIEFEKGEVVEWVIVDKANMLLHRPEAPPGPMALKKTPRLSSKGSKRS